MHGGTPMDNRNAECLRDFENVGHWKFSVGHSTFFASVCRINPISIEIIKASKSPLPLSVAKEKERDLG
jgi:hypothetical protein